MKPSSAISEVNILLTTIRMKCLAVLPYNLMCSASRLQSCCLQFSWNHVLWSKSIFMILSARFTPCATLDFFSSIAVTNLQSAEKCEQCALNDVYQ
jgi:hypothetical protein